MTKRAFTLEQDKEIAGLYQQRYSTRKIANIFGVEKSAISNALERQGVDRRTNRDLTDSEEVQIAKIYGFGYSVPKIAKAYNKSVGFIHDAIERQSTKKRDDRFIFCQSEENEIAKVYQSGKTIEAMSRAYGCKNKSIRDALTRNGISIRIIARKPIIKKPPRIFKSAITNETAFDVLDNESALYFLGFAYADCDTNQSQLRVGLSIKDLEQVKRISKFLGGNPDSIRVYDNKCNAEFSSNHLANRLRSLGVSPRRGEFYRLASQIPVGLEHHFIRGYLDGDGCISNREKVIFLGQSDILLWIKDCLVKYAQASDKVMPYQRRGIMEITWGGSYQFIRVIDYIYKDATLYLERKKSIADKAKRG